MAKRSRLPDLPNDHRCTRNGTNWRCHLPRLPNKSYCHKHHLFNLSRSQSKSKNPQQTPIHAPKNSSSSNLREIWAFHHSPNGYPNLYARIDRIIPSKSQVEVTPLIPLDPNPDNSNAGCGLFRASDTSETREMSGVSHRVWFDMEAEYLYKIYPRKGEVWAVDVYQWVEMVSSFGDEVGASGLVLVVDGVEGFKRKLYDGCELIRRFSLEEVRMFRYRESGARVLGVDGKCTSTKEQDRATGSIKEENTDHVSVISNFEGVNADEIAMRSANSVIVVENTQYLHFGA